MAIEVRDFELMVEDTLDRIVESGINITNRNPGSVIRTLVENILAETDIQYYQISRLYNSLDIDSAVGEDLDKLISILGTIRKPATKCTGVVTFSRETLSESDIYIQYAHIISTKQSTDGTVHEFMVNDTEAVLLAGQLSVDVNVIALEPGSIYIPANVLNIMNIPIIGIESVYNRENINGGSDEEDDITLRERAKHALSGLGKGTNDALRSAVTGISGVLDAMVIDMNRGVGTSDIVTVTDIIPPPTELNNEILDVISKTKSSGIDVGVIYPEITQVNVDVQVFNISDILLVKNSIIEYFNTLKISDTFIINQMEKYVLNAYNNKTADIKTIIPIENIVVGNTEIIRHGTITINGEIV